MPGRPAAVSGQDSDERKWDRGHYDQRNSCLVEMFHDQNLVLVTIPF
jgi:hypothetical protein